MKDSFRRQIVYSCYILLVLIAIGLWIGILNTVNLYAATTTFDQAESLPLDDNLHYSNLTEDSRSLWYRVAIPEDGYLKLQLKTEFTYCYMTLYNGDQTKKYIDNHTWGTGAPDNPGIMEETRALESGVYYIHIFSSNNSGRFAIRPSFTAAGNTEGKKNRSFTSALDISNSQPVIGFLSADNEKEFYKFTVPKDGFLTLQMKAELKYCHLALYNADQTKTYFDNRTWGNGVLDNPEILTETRALDAGTYYIAIFSDTNTGRYTLKGTFEAAENTDGKSNRSFKDAMLLSSSKNIRGFLSEDNRADFYKITLPKKDTLTVTLKAEFGYCYMTVFNEEQTTTYFDNRTWGNGKPNNPEVLLMSKDLEAGTYYIRIKSDNTTGVYTLESSVPTQAKFISMYRLYNTHTGEHFYTSKSGERNSLVKVGWKYEGIAWNAPTSGTPVYRLYNKNAGDHHYTTSVGERNNLVRAGWRDEGIGWYSGGKTPVYRQYNPNAKTGSHNFTTSKSENTHLAKIGWKAEGIAWYAV